MGCATLYEVCDRILVDGLTPYLAEAVRQQLDRGATPLQVLGQLVRAGGLPALTELGVEAVMSEWCKRERHSLARSPEDRRRIGLWYADLTEGMSFPVTHPAGPGRPTHYTDPQGNRIVYPPDLED